MLTLALSPEIEAALAAQAEASGLELAAYAAQLLERAVTPSVSKPNRSREDFRAWLEQFTQFSDRIPSLPGETFSREMIYQDRA